MEAALLVHAELVGNEGALGGGDGGLDARSPAMDLHELARRVKAVEVATDGGLGGIEGLSEVGYSYGGALPHHLDHLLATFLREHAMPPCTALGLGCPARAVHDMPRRARSAAYYCTFVRGSVQ